MKREILCQTCAAERRGDHPEDVANGWRSRVVVLGRTETPPDHGLTVNGTFSPLPSLLCDHCNLALADGAPAVALTTWNINREQEPANWETEYIKWIV